MTEEKKLYWDITIAKKDGDENFNELEVYNLEKDCIKIYVLKDAEGNDFYERKCVIAADMYDEQGNYYHTELKQVIFNEISDDWSMTGHIAGINSQYTNNLIGKPSKYSLQDFFVKE